MELIGLPTAAGREGRVIGWVQAWARRRPTVQLRQDRYGNLMLQRRGARSTSPVIFTAHMDHPAFVVERVLGAQQIEAGFRGGVNDPYFVTGPPRVLLHHGEQTIRGQVLTFRPAIGDGFKGARIDLEQPVAAQIGDVVTWSVGTPHVREDWLFAPACDDLAGVAAALGAFDVLLKSRARKSPDVRILLTRAEEVGFLGAIAACKSGLIPQGASVINIECSRSFADSPIGEGPIVRVGDKTSTFDPDLTYRVGQVAEQLAQRDATFKYQRRLMPGGTCEASAFQSFGHTAACVCLPLGNYHNMNEEAGQIDAEYISPRDFDRLVRLLAEVGSRLNIPARSPSLRDRLDRLFTKRRSLLDR